MFAGMVMYRCSYPSEFHSEHPIKCSLPSLEGPYTPTATRRQQPGHVNVLESHTLRRRNITPAPVQPFFLHFVALTT